MGHHHVTDRDARPLPPADRTVVGWREWIHLTELLDGGWIKAKVDTGARTSALHAWDVERFGRDGGDWVRFSVHPRQHDDVHVIQTEAKLVEEREVRSSNAIGRAHV